MNISYQPIGLIYSPFDSPEGMPIQPPGAKAIQGKIEVFPEYEEGLKDLDGFSHIILLYHFHRKKDFKLTVTPFLDTQSHGVFATRAPGRPNPIGISIVKLILVEGNRLTIENVDILNETPLLDIKPYVPEFDQPQVTRSGWLEKAHGKVTKKRSDDRFK